MNLELDLQNLQIQDVGCNIAISNLRANPRHPKSKPLTPKRLTHDIQMVNPQYPNSYSTTPCRVSWVNILDVVG